MDKTNEPSKFDHNVVEENFSLILDETSESLRPIDFPMPNLESVPYADTNVSATSGCSQCC